MFCFTTGPVHAFVQFLGESPLFLGNAETDWEITLDPSYVNVNNSLAGPVKPFQKTWAGESATVSGVLTRWDAAVYRRLRTHPFHGVAGAPATPAGTESRLARGALVLNRGTFQLILQNSFFGTVNQVSPDEPPGWRFVAASLAGHVPGPTGTTASKLGLVLSCDSLYDPTDGSWTLYSQDPAISSLQPN